MSLNHVVGGAPSKPLHAVFDQLTVIGDAQIGGGLDIGDISADVIEFGDNGQGGRNKLPIDPPANGQVLKANTATGEMEWGDAGIPSGDVTITGNLTVEQNLQVDGQIISELKVEDAIIESNVGGLDSNNSGWMANGDGDTLFSGLIRDGTTKKFHLFNAAVVKPSPIGAMPSPDGDLLCRSLAVEQINANDMICGNLEADLITVGDPGVNGYQLPAATGTLDQFLTCDGAGATAWANVPTSTLIRSPDGITFAQANDGVFVADSEGTEFINATPTTTIFRGGGVDNPEIKLRSGILSSSISTQGRNVFVFGATFTKLGYDLNDSYAEYQSNLIAERVGGIIRKRVDLASGAMIDAATQERIGYDGTQTTITSPNGSNFMRVTNTDMDLSWNGLLKQEISSISTLLRGGITNQSELLLGGGPFGLRYTYEGDARLLMSSTQTFINSPSITSQFNLDDSDVRITLSNPAVRQFSATAAETYIASLNATTRATLTDSTVNIQVAGDSKIVSDGTSTRLIAPSGGNKLDVLPDSIEASGAFVVKTSDVNAIQIRSNAAAGQAGDLQQWQVNSGTVSRMDNLGNIYTPNSFLTAANAAFGGLDASPLNICPSTSTQLNLGYAGIDTRIKSSLTVENSQQLKLGSSSAMVEKPVSVKMVSNAVLIKGLVLKIVDVGGVARVSPVLAGDPDDSGVFGISLGPAIVGGDVDVAIGGLFECSVQSGAAVSIGDLVEKSPVVGQDGRIISPAIKAGTFGIALTAGVGSVDGSVRVLVAFKKNEVF
jgi:hypothetical protein